MHVLQGRIQGGCSGCWSTPLCINYSANVQSRCVLVSVSWYSEAHFAPDFASMEVLLIKAQGKGQSSNTVHTREFKVDRNVQASSRRCRKRGRSLNFIVLSIFIPCNYSKSVYVRVQQPKRLGVWSNNLWAWPKKIVRVSSLAPPLTGVLDPPLY